MLIRETFGASISETLFIMFGPGGASGPYTLVMPERCIPWERILCERYTSGAALLHSIANNMIAGMEDILGTIYGTLFSKPWAGSHTYPLSFGGAMQSLYHCSKFVITFPLTSLKPLSKPTSFPTSSTVHQSGVVGPKPAWTDCRRWYILRHGLSPASANMIMSPPLSPRSAGPVSARWSRAMTR